MTNKLYQILEHIEIDYRDSHGCLTDDIELLRNLELELQGWSCEDDVDLLAKVVFVSDLINSCYWKSRSTGSEIIEIRASILNHVYNELGLNNIIIICSSSIKEIKKTEEEIGCYGFKTLSVCSPKRLKSLLTKFHNGISAIVIDMDNFSTNDFVPPVSVPVICYSLSSELDKKLKSAEIGCHRYITGSASVPQIYTAIREIASLDQGQKSVLLVEDELITLMFTQKRLEKDGFKVHSAKNGLEAYKILEDEDVDIIVSDVSMPECDGKNLLNLVRQEKRFDNIPFIFVTGVNDLDSVQSLTLERVSQVIPKTGSLEYLISTVRKWVREGSVNSERYLKDGLTGIYSHSASKDIIARNVAGMKRHGESGCLAILDLDHFKSVNDKYGHPVGDNVLISFSRLLEARLRKSDTCGRVGGEEFVALLKNTSLEHGKKVIDELSSSFSKIIHSGNGEDFKVTFSCGIVSINDFESVKEIEAAADQALYEAKRLGRNRTCSIDAS